MGGFQIYKITSAEKEKQTQRKQKNEIYVVECVLRFLNPIPVSTLNQFVTSRKYEELWVEDREELRESLICSLRSPWEARRPHGLCARLRSLVWVFGDTSLSQCLSPPRCQHNWVPAMLEVTLGLGRDQDPI